MWNYIFRLGFLDGREGLLLHLYHATYVSWKYAKAWHGSLKTQWEASVAAKDSEKAGSPDVIEPPQSKAS